MAQELEAAKKQKDDAKVDPEMLKNLDLLLNYDVLESEEDFELFEELDSEESEDEAS